MSHIVVNTFHVAPEQASQFEERCRQPYRFVQHIPGLEAYQLLRGDAQDGTIRYVAHSRWTSKEALQAWTRSYSFVHGHYVGRLPARMLCGQPQRETFEAVPLDGA